MIATIEQLKQNLNIEPDYTEEDNYLGMLLQVAEDAVFNYLDKKPSDFEVVPSPIVFACLILSSQWYESRTPVSFSQGYKIPYSFEFLLSPYKDYIVL